jgi:ankyrin repeat protein
MIHRKQLPARASIEQLKKQAKDLLAEARAGSAEAEERVKRVLPAFRGNLADAQLVLAREYGFRSWTELRRRVEAIDLADPKTAFTEAACIPMDGSWHGSGDRVRADAILAAHPEVASADVFLAAILGDDSALARFLDADPSAATTTGGLYDWDPLTYLCFSRYLRDDERTASFTRAARLLLERGASANTGFYWQEHEPGPCFEAVLYGAAAVAKQLEVTRALLDHGADPNDGETAYHLPEGYDNAVMKLVVETGRVDRISLMTMLARKHDWHDYEGIAWLLEHGAEANGLTSWGRRALHQAIERDNALRIFALLLDHGADPRLPSGAGKSAVALAARAGRGDVLDLFAQRGHEVKLDGAEAFLAACARGDAAGARALLAAEPALVRAIEADDPVTLAAFAAAGNTAGVALLLDLGFDPAIRASVWISHDATPLHAAIWRGRHETAKLLVARGAPLEAHNGRGETPLAYAVRAKLESHWPGARTTESVEALLAAGADTSVLAQPTGWDALDALLRSRCNA